MSASLFPSLLFSAPAFRTPDINNRVSSYTVRARVRCVTGRSFVAALRWAAFIIMNNADPVGSPFTPEYGGNREDHEYRGAEDDLFSEELLPVFPELFTARTFCSGFAVYAALSRAQA